MLGETGGVRRRVGGNWSGPVVGREQSGRRELREKGTERVGKSCKREEDASREERENGWKELWECGPHIATCHFFMWR